MQKGTEELSPSQGGIRRSSRNRVPNPIYKEGIKELKRGLNRNGKSKQEGSQIEEDEIDSYSESIKSDNGQWIKCSIENEDGSYKDLLISIKVNKPIVMTRKQSFAKPKSTKTKQTDKKTQDDTKKYRKKSIVPQQQEPQGGTGLFQLLINAAQKVMYSENPENADQNNEQSQKESYQEIPKPKRQSKQDREGKLLSVTLEKNKIIFEHSKLKTIQMKSQPPIMQMQQSTHLSNGMSLEEIENIFENHKKHVYQSSIFI